MYNAFTLQLNCKHDADDKLKSINQLHALGSLLVGVATKRSISWHTWKFSIGGVAYTLDEVEHTILGGGGESNDKDKDKVHDPRFHAAINCASESCPPLSRKPYGYDAESVAVDRQLDRRMRDFVQRTCGGTSPRRPTRKKPRKATRRPRT